MIRYMADGDYIFKVDADGHRISGSEEDRVLCACGFLYTDRAEAHYLTGTCNDGFEACAVEAARLAAMWSWFGNIGRRERAGGEHEGLRKLRRRVRRP